MARSNVLLPAPDGPTIESVRPGATLKLTSATAAPEVRG